MWLCSCQDGYVLTADLKTCLGRFKPGVYIWQCSCRDGHILTADLGLTRLYVYIWPCICWDGYVLMADLRTCLGRFKPGV